MVVTLIQLEDDVGQLNQDTTLSMVKDYNFIWWAVMD